MPKKYPKSRNLDIYYVRIRKAGSHGNKKKELSRLACRRSQINKDSFLEL